MRPPGKLSNKEQGAKKVRYPALFTVFAGLIAERLDRLDFERFQVNDEHAPAAAARVTAAVRGGAAQFGHA